MQKGTAALFLLVAGLVIVVVGFLAFRLLKSPSSNLQSPATNVSPVSRISTYTNQVLGFEFEYPKEFSVKEDSEKQFNKRGNGDFRKNFKGYVGYEPGNVLGAVLVLEKDENYGTNPFAVWVFNNNNNLTMEQWFQNYWYYPFLWGVFDYTSKGHIALDKEATVSGKIGKSKVVAYQPGSPEFIYISNDKKMYLFRIIGEAGDKILSSFKFMNPSPTPTVVPTGTPSDQVCIQVITAAKDTTSGECREFPTPCDVPEGWEKVGSCGK